MPLPISTAFTACSDMTAPPRASRVAQSHCGVGFPSPGGTLCATLSNTPPTESPVRELVYLPLSWRCSASASAQPQSTSSLRRGLRRFLSHGNFAINNGRGSTAITWLELRIPNFSPKTVWPIAPWPRGGGLPALGLGARPGGLSPKTYRASGKIVFEGSRADRLSRGARSYAACAFRDHRFHAAIPSSSAKSRFWSMIAIRVSRSSYHDAPGENVEAVSRSIFMRRPGPYPCLAGARVRIHKFPDLRPAHGATREKRDQRLAMGLSRSEVAQP